jgi:hypothetical protein
MGRRSVIEPPPPTGQSSEVAPATVGTIRVCPLNYLIINKFCVESQSYSRDGVMNGLPYGTMGIYHFGHCMALWLESLDELSCILWLERRLVGYGQSFCQNLRHNTRGVSQ